MSFRIVVVGSLNVDMVTRTEKIPEGGETVTAKSFAIGWGGKGANQAVAAQRLGIKVPGLEQENLCVVKMIGAVGDDDFGKQMLESLKKDGIDTSAVKKLKDYTTGTATILVEEKTGQNRILVTPGANSALTDDDDWLSRDPKEVVDAYGDVCLFQLENPLNAVLGHIRKAHASSCKVVSLCAIKYLFYTYLRKVIFNPAPAVPLPDDVYKCIHYLIVNETEAEILSNRRFGGMSDGLKKDLPSSVIDELNEIAKIFIQKGVRVVIITLGSAGVFFTSAYAIEHGVKGTYVPALKAKVVDTTAAGDTFVGACAVSLAQAYGIRSERAESFDHDSAGRAVRFGQFAAAKTVEKQGAQSSIPFGYECQEFEG
jgi:ribokinase